MFCRSEIMYVRCCVLFADNLMMEEKSEAGQGGEATIDRALFCTNTNTNTNTNTTLMMEEKSEAGGGSHY